MNRSQSETGHSTGQSFDEGFLGSGPLLVGIDWPQGSEHTLQWSASVARRAKRTVTLLHAISPWVGVEFAIPPLDYEEYRASVEHDLETWAKGLGDIDHDLRIVEDDLADALVSAATDLQPGLIVVGNHGTGRLSGRLLTSMLGKALHGSGTPMAVVPRTAPAEAIQGDLVVGVDGSPSSLRALHWAARSGPVLQVGVYGATSLSSRPSGVHPSLIDPHSTDPIADTLAALRELAKQVAAETGARISSDVLVGDPARRLSEATDGNLALVVGGGEQRWPSHTELGSTTRRCVLHSPTPVIVVP